jgi:signal transduction histidine kinase
MAPWRVREGASLRLVLQVFIGAAALSNWIVLYLHPTPAWPLEWYQTPAGPVVERVYDRTLRGQVPPGSLWLLMDGLPVQDAADTVRRVQRLRVGDTVTLTFLQDRRLIHATWTVSGRRWFPTVWVAATGALLWGIALWLRVRYSYRRFYRRMWTAVLSLSMVYMFTPVGTWDWLDHFFWAMDRIGFAVAPIAILYWATGWPPTHPGRFLRPLRKTVPALWLGLHGLPLILSLTGWVSPWSRAFLRLHHVLWNLDGVALLGAFGYAFVRCLRVVSHVHGLERGQLQILASAIFLAFFPTLVAAVPIGLGRSPELWETMAVLTHPVLPLGLLMATRQRRWDVEHLFRRALTYAPLLIGLVALYMILYGLVLRLLPSDWTAQAFLMALLATVPGIFVFPALRQWSVRWVERMYLGARSHPLEELQRVIWHEAGVGPLHPWLARVLGLIEEAMDCAWTDAWLQTQDDRRWVRTSGPPSDLKPFLERVLFRSEESGAQGRLIRPGIDRHTGAGYTLYRIHCATDVGIQAELWCVWRHTDHWLSRDELDRMEQVRARVQQVLKNYSLLLEAERQNRALEDLRRFYQAVLQTLDVGILVTDRDHRTVLMANRSLARWFQTTPEAMQYQDLRTYLPADFVDRVQQFFEHPMGSLPVLQVYLNLPGVAPRLLQVSRCPLQIPMEDRTTEGFLYVLEDITHLHRLEQQLIQSEKLSSIGLLAAGIAHEINTPLTGIMSYTQMLRQRLQDPKARQLLHRVQDQVDQIRQIVQTFLDMAQPRRQTARVLELQQTVQQGLRLLRPLLKDYPIRLHVELAPQPVYVWGHEAQIHQVLTNLVVNARDAMPDGGDLTVRVRQEGGSAVLEVQDTGVGMDEATLRRAFDPFFTTKAHQGGTGLGLTISYHIVRQHGGRIEVQSRPGHGSLFRVYFPVWSEGVHRAVQRTIVADR